MGREIMGIQNYVPSHLAESTWGIAGGREAE